MQSVDQALLDQLRGIEMDLARLAHDDLDTLATIGAALEAAASAIPATYPRATELAELCLEALQSIYMKTVVDPSAAVQNTKRAVAGLQRYLRANGETSLDTIGQILWTSLGKSAAESPWQEAAPAAEPEAEPESEPVALVLVAEPEAEPESDDESAWDNNNNEIIQEFLVESYENLDQLDQDLLALEKDPNDRTTISSIFRTIHTIKGTCGFLGFAKLEKLTHAGENLLSLLRDGDLNLTEAITNALLAMVDAVREVLGCIGSSGREGATDYSVLTETLTRLQTEPDSEIIDFISPTLSPAPVAVVTSVAPVAVVEEATTPAELAVSYEQQYQDTPKQVNTLQPVRGRLGDVLIQQGYIQVGDLARALREQEAGDQRRLGEILASMGLVTGDIVERALQALGGANATRSNATEANIRVDVGLLDDLMNLVGELVLTRNQIVQLLQGQNIPNGNALLATSQRLNLITSELQEGVMKTRMQPIGNVWSKFPRVVRDLAHSCNKQIRLEMEGKETDLDKTLIEAIKDPLTHLVRNSVDHGIELPSVRVAAGKPAEGVLTLRAYHEGGQVNIEIVDDGGGIDAARVKAKAIERGLITPEQSALMSERDVLHMIFQPGFSTAQTVTNISGRGVGMDVVKTNIEKIGGNIDIQSQKGKGTTIKIKIPLTLAIVSALLVSVGEERFAIPQVSLVELLRLEPERAVTGIEYVYGAPIYRLRGKLLPLVFLHDELGLKSEKKPTDAVNIVVLQANERHFGLVVDSITDTEEIVVKPLSKHLRGVPVFAGATIMGDGKVALILDTIALAQAANLISETGQSRSWADTVVTEAAGTSQIQTLLLFQTGLHDRMAIPLSTVTRIEELPSSSVERIGHREVVQYRGQIMPLFRLAALFPDIQTDTTETPSVLQVVVVGEEGHCVGMIVDNILDIVEEKLTLHEESENRMVVGTAVIRGRVTQVLDMNAVLNTPHEEDYGNSTPVLHLLPGGLSLRGVAHPGSGSTSSPAHDQGSEVAAHDRRAHQPTGSDRNGDRPAEAPDARRAA